MQLITLPTEQTTAATDALLAAIAVYCALVLQRFRAANPFKVRIWTWTLLLLACAAALGFIAHGIDMRPEMRNLAWQPLNLALGLVVALFCTGALLDLWGEHLAHRALLPMVCIGASFYAVTLAMDEAFLIFDIYELLAMCAVLIIYAWLAVVRRFPGSALMLAATLINILAAALQATDVRFNFIWQFDHNGVFHLVQSLGVVLLTVGLRSALMARDRRSVSLECSEPDHGPIGS
jgi:hypothetical protein